MGSGVPCFAFRCYEMFRLRARSRGDKCLPGKIRINLRNLRTKRPFFRPQITQINTNCYFAEVPITGYRVQDYPGNFPEIPTGLTY